VKDGINAKPAIVTAASVSEGIAGAILDFAKDNGIDLIIMTTHGRGGIARWTMGSVTDRVIRFSNVPVLTIPSE